MQAFLHSIGTAVPPHDVHEAFLGWARRQLAGRREAALFDRMAGRAGIDRRWSVLPDTSFDADADGFYRADEWPGTAARMAVYAEETPDLACAAIARLGEQVPLTGITHVVLASCTGFVAPGIDQIIARRLGLAPSVERLLVGFMGCYAAVAALRSARHIVRSEPAARVLVVTVELCTLHLQDTAELEPVLAMLQFGDGAAAALVTGEAGEMSKGGLLLDRPFSTTLADSHELIRWDITDQGFAMHLSGAVPNRIAGALAEEAFARALGCDPHGVDGWAVHAGGRSILDAVERALTLDGHALDHSRAVLADNGNMSSATLMFVLQRLLAGPPVANGVALAFGPGLAAEGLTFRSAP
ncbi:type III polyketide synthase [Croceibacterium sp. TMG7-5b_MA50]|uniref:type III polyketide synthase n=1 Tax=Croceibacterium sp. TMG7-5b_MA50 TaxID=3121290 RepID=UPI0032217877